MSLRWLAPLTAVCAVVPLLVPELWSGFRLAWSDPVLSVLSATEQPLSVRQLAGVWAMALVLLWFGLAYRSRRVGFWEVALVLVGGAAALARLGNAWLLAGALVLPLTRQLRFRKLTAWMLSLGAAASLAVGVVVGVSVWPPAISTAAVEAVGTTGSGDVVLADWRWAPQVQQRLGPSRQVRAAGGLSSESSNFWLDYVLVAQGHEHWADTLRQLNIDVVVLDASDQQHALADLIRDSPDWQVVNDASGALVAERSRP